MKTKRYMLYLPSIIMFIVGFTCVAQLPNTSIYDRYKNFGEEYIIQQQSQMYLPTPTPSGLIENPFVTNARQIVYTSTNQNHANNANTIIN